VARFPRPLGAAHQDRRLVEVAQHTRGRVGLERRLREPPADLAEQLGLLDDPPPDRSGAIAPSLVQCPDLAGGKLQPRARRRQRQGILGIGARQGQEKAHRRVRRDLA